MIKRHFYLEKLRNLRDLNVIKVVTGVRRCGKSTLLEQFCSELKDQKSKVNIISYNLEEKENKDIIKDSDTFYSSIMKSIDPFKKNYVFIDEVQMVPEFETVIDSLFVKGNIDIYITGSNAYMTSSEISTLLTGRYVEIKMLPLSFAEFRQFFPNNFDKSELFEFFLNYGGFPEVANFLVAKAKNQISDYLMAIYNTILEKDISIRADIRNMKSFRNVVRYLFDNIGNYTSPNNIANVLKNANSSINKLTVANYIESLQNSFIMYNASRFDIRGKKLLKTIEKYYVVDLGLVEAILGRPTTTNLGHRLENIVYLELLKRYGTVWVGKNYNKEIDFVIKNSQNVIEYFQVSLSVVTKSTLDREISGFKNTGDNFRKTLLTMDNFSANDNGIERKNVIDWLLEYD
ncbi:MAG: ATP-binding protein [Bifidobacteriaceae bacterium]|jgi:predicted AAA+ superfamily ATPase|nr:ATP-binding protein [Bifidobacteriaceae bacterium]